MWKERLWQVFLVAILGLTLTMCSRSSSNKSTSSTGILNADGTTTVTVSSLPSITLANAGPSAISHTMFCKYANYSSEVVTYSSCDASDDTVLSSGAITHDAALAAGWKLVGPGCGGGSGAVCVLFQK
ncbi:MAG: hypothetical protein ISR65_20375 [Bacteriovoracaceae bacterium]|nr:hypothetical protein [Bacteriovoracaceae bacterium]